MVRHSIAQLPSIRPENECRHTPERGPQNILNDTIPAIAELASQLAHRYDFSGIGSAVLDSVGAADGTAIGVSLDGSGKLYLSGDDEYVNLPGGLISELTSVSIECWVNWSASTASSWRGDTTGTWQSLFTFGVSDQGVGRAGNGTRYIYLTPQSPSYYGNDLRAGYSLTGFNTESYVGGDGALPLSSDTDWGTQVVYVLDSAQNQLTLYVNGTLAGTSQSSQQIALSAITDVNGWLGRSLFTEGTSFEGELLDVRIYRTALSAGQVELSFDLGPDAAL